MKNSKIMFLFLLFLVGSLPACPAKNFKFTGRENDQQALAKCVQLSTHKKFQEAIDCLEIFKSRFPESPYTKDAEIRIADSYYRKKEYLLAAETYQLFTKLHPTSDKLDYVYYRMGLCYLHETPKQIDRDQEHLPEAIDSLGIVVQQFPDSPYAKAARFRYNEARKRIAKRDFYVGYFYYNWGEYKAAIPRFQEIYQKYENLGLDEKALYYTVAAYKKLGKIEDAKLVFELLKAKFPNSSKTKEIQKDLFKS